MQYKIEFLNDEQFDALPYTRATTSVGLADRENGIAYVRETGVNMLDVFTAIHELQHMSGDDLGEHEDSEQPGVYYKGFGDVIGAISNVASAIPGPWQLPAVAYSGYNAIKGAGRGQQQPQQQEQPSYGNAPMGNFSTPGMMPSMGSQSPNVSYPGHSMSAAPGGAGAVAAGASTQGPGIGAMSPQQQMLGQKGIQAIRQQMYGNYAGR